MFVLPGLIWRFLKWVSPPVFAFGAYAIIVGFGYWLLILTLVGDSSSLPWAFSVLTGGVYAPIWLLATRKRTRTLKAFTFPPTIAAAIFCVFILCLHLGRPGPGRFDFLGNRAVSFEMTAPTPGYLEWAYTFPADCGQVEDAAERELLAKGYEVDRRRGQFVAYKGDSVAMSIHRKRAVGTHFWVDGDVLEFASDPGWATVDHIEEDIYPIWLQVFVP